MKRARRVLLVAKGLDLGGLERVVADLAVGLQRRGIETTVAVVADDRQRLTPRLVAGGVTVRPLGGTDRIGRHAALALWRIVAGRRDGTDPPPDIVHVHGPLPAVVARMAPGSRQRVVTTLHTPWAALHAGTRTAWRLTNRRDHTLVAVSSAVAASLPRHIARRAIVIPHGVDRDLVNEVAIHRDRCRASLLDELSITADSSLVVTVASHRRAKNYPNLLRAFRDVHVSTRSAHLLAVGEGDQLGAHVRLAGELGISGSVTFMPPREDVLSVLAAADVVAMASDYEGQPLVVVEALALGRPIVATAVGRVPELIPPGAGLIVAPDDSAALAKAMIELLGDAERRQRMSVAARASHESSWSLDDALDAHEALYDRVLADPNRVGSR